MSSDQFVLVSILFSLVSSPVTLGVRPGLLNVSSVSEFLYHVIREYFARGTFSPERLKRELRSVSAGCGSQSVPASPCRLPLTYFPLSLLSIGSPVACYYPQKKQTVKGESAL